VATLSSAATSPSSLFRTASANSKAGLAWPNGDYNDIKQYESAKVSWYVPSSPGSFSDNFC
jgi:hypothetical protein